MTSTGPYISIYLIVWRTETGFPKENKRGEILLVDLLPPKRLLKLRVKRDFSNLSTRNKTSTAGLGTGGSQGIKERG